MSKRIEHKQYKSSIFNKLPINLLRKAVRERRNRNERKRPSKHRQWKIRRRKPNFERSEHDALVRATELQLQKILANNEVLSDIPYDYTPEELLGEIALAKGEGTTVYVQRDGLSTLTIVLPQPEPTIANLKRAIEATSRAQLKRELCERHEERLRRRRGDAIVQSAVMQESNSNTQQVAGVVLEPPVSTGELVYSTARNGHQHRSNVSWRFLWRAFALFNVDTNSPLNDINGRKLLSACGIENASTLKFCKREAYFGRKRQ